MEIPWPRYLVHQRFVHPGPLVLGTAPLKQMVLFTASMTACIVARMSRQNKGMTAMTDIRPPQTGQAQTPTSYTLRSGGPRRSYAPSGRYPGSVAISSGRHPDRRRAHTSLRERGCSGRGASSRFPADSTVPCPESGPRPCASTVRTGQFPRRWE
jgi:hypothetical protein